MDVVEVWPVGDLPVLTQLTLVGNPVAAAIEYRTRVLQAFGTRANEVINSAFLNNFPKMQIRLDNRLANARELDIVAVRLAIHSARHERELAQDRQRNQIHERIKVLCNKRRVQLRRILLSDDIVVLLGGRQGLTSP
ncbi:unnamed protein product [Sphagnum balticum]